MIVGFGVGISISAALFSPVKIVIAVFFAVDEDRIGGFFVHAFGSADSEVTAVVSRQGGVEGQLDGFSVGTADHCGDDITLGKMCLFQSFVIALILHDELMESCGLGGEGRKGEHPVSVVDIQDPGDRSQIVSRIVFAVSGQIISKAVMSVLFSECDFVSQIMLISTGAVNYLTENTLFYHI